MYVSIFCYILSKNIINIYFKKYLRHQQLNILLLFQLIYSFLCYDFYVFLKKRTQCIYIFYYNQNKQIQHLLLYVLHISNNMNLIHLNWTLIIIVSFSHYYSSNLIDQFDLTKLIKYN